MKVIVYIGQHYYWDSGTSMSSIYTEDGRRYDWGFMQNDLEAGETIIIRQATPAELERYAKQLKVIQRKLEEE